MVVWIWIGGFFVGVGSLFAIWPDRRRAVVLAAARATSVESVPGVTPTLEQG
jgi:cytochrome c biogenesis factor